MKVTSTKGCMKGGIQYRMKFSWLTRRSLIVWSWGQRSVWKVATRWSGVQKRTISSDSPPSGSSCWSGLTMNHTVSNDVHVRVCVCVHLLCCCVTGRCMCSHF